MPYELMEEDTQEKPNENVLQGIVRQKARQVSNLATRAVGLPGDVMSLVNEYIANPTVEFFGGPNIPYEQTLVGKILPTTETHRKGVEGTFGEYLKPQNEVEKFVDDVIEDTALLFAPGSKGVKASKQIPKAFKRSLGVNVAAKGVSGVTGSETAGDYTKLGGLLALSVLDAPSAAKQISALYKNAESKLPENAKISSTKINRQLSSLEDSITKKRPRENLSAPEKFVIDQIDKVKNLTASGDLSIEQAIAQKRSLNKELSTLFKEVPNPKEQQNVKNLAKKVNGYLNESIEEYGRKNPEFYKKYKEADKAYGVMAQSQFVSKWIENHVAYTPATNGLLHLLGTSAATKASVLVAPYQVTKLGYRVIKSPTLRKIYLETIRAASKENAGQFNKLLERLDKELQKEESKDRFEFIE